MNLARFALRHRTIVLAVVFVLLVFGVDRFLTMSRREDPEITIRACVVLTQWPGANAEKVEELVTDPLEDAIDQIDEVDKITSKTRTGLSIITVELEDTVTDEIDQIWDEVRSKVAQVEPHLPDGVRRPNVNADFGDVYSVIYALHQVPPPGRTEIERQYGYRQLEVLAETVRDDLKAIEAVARVTIEGAPEEVIWVEVDEDWAKVGVTVEDLRKLLGGRNIVAAGGEINSGPFRFTVTPTGEFTSVEQMRDVLVSARDGEVPVRLGDLPVTIRRGYVEPMQTRFRLVAPGVDADRCLLLAVSMKSGHNLVELGAEIERHVQQLRRTTLPPDLALVRINDLPAQVDTLVRDFVVNLVEAIAIVLAVALLMMGWRAGLVMATAVPLCMIASILVVSLLGVELEQFSIASLIIALGMLVDNAIVVSDNVLREMEAGRSSGEARQQAAIDGAHGLAVPILTSTATTVAAFLPMLTIIGSVGEYTRSLPIVVATTLIVSYLVAMTVTPIMCFWLLQPRAQRAPHVSLTARLLALLPRRGKAPPQPRAADAPGGYEKAVRWCLRHRLVTLGAAAIAVVGALSLVPAIGSQFFPQGVRDQFFVHVWLPEGSSLAATDAKCREVETILRRTSPMQSGGQQVERLRNATSFIGTGGPRINLTTNPQQSFPNYAFVLVNTTDATLSRPWAQEIKAQTDRIPGVRIDVTPFMLGPYIENPVEFRLSGNDSALLREKAETMIGVFRQTPGTVNPFSDWYDYGYGVEVDIDEETANLAGVTNQAVADTMDALVSGGYLTTYREGDHQIKVMLRIGSERRTALLDDLGMIYVDGSAGKVPLETLANVTATWQPAVIARRDGVRTVTVGCKVAPGALPNKVAASVRPRLQAMMATLPPSYRLQEGGEAEQTTESQQKLLSAFTLSFFLILLVLIAQYDSLVKPLVVLSTVPLALIGALLGLWATGWAIGFMPSLGIISLAGVVINNAIILIDFIETNVAQGAALDDAIAKAGSQRMQPIVLTTLTTVGGLVPLALFGGPMWAGMAWAMIFGLSLSTALTLLVVPTLYAACVRLFRLG